MAHVINLANDVGPGRVSSDCNVSFAVRDENAGHSDYETDACLGHAYCNVGAEGNSHSANKRKGHLL
jgi:hypothetical protein